MILFCICAAVVLWAFFLRPAIEAARESATSENREGL